MSKELDLIEENKKYYEQELADIDYKWFGIKRNKTKDEKIADLEAKLAESDELIENYKMGYTGKVWKKQNKKISILKSVVKDKDEIIDKLKKVILDLSYTVNNDANNSLYILEKNNELKQQLAEKDKEIDERMMVFEKRCQEYYKSKEFAVEQLEKVKGAIQHNILFVDCDDYLNVIEEIDNQIKELCILE